MQGGCRGAPSCKPGVRAAVSGRWRLPAARRAPRASGSLDPAKQAAGREEAPAVARGWARSPRRGLYRQRQHRRARRPRRQGGSGPWGRAGAPGTMAGKAAAAGLSSDTRPWPPRRQRPPGARSPGRGDSAWPARSGGKARLHPARIPLISGSALGQGAEDGRSDKLSK